MSRWACHFSLEPRVLGFSCPLPSPGSSPCPMPALAPRATGRARANWSLGPTEPARPAVRGQGGELAQAAAAAENREKGGRTYSPVYSHSRH